ncbi:MAG: leucyl aminopeptidase [Bacteroidales bacterium]
MQTVIHLTSKPGKRDNVALFISRPSDIDETLLTAEEKKYVSGRFRQHKARFFILNRLDRIIFVSIPDLKGSRAEKLQQFRLEGVNIGSEANRHKINTVTVTSPVFSSEELLAVSEGMALRNYQFLGYKSKKDELINTLGNIYVVGKKALQSEVDRLNIVVDAVSRCRDLVNEPPANLTATDLAKAFEQMGRKAGFRVEVFSKKKIESLKMGGLLAVNRGSVEPPTFTVMEWKPENAINKRPYVLVGKGVVFDSGGMNIKTGNFMNDMKMDMAGAASVAATIYAAAASKIPLHVVALVPATDNRLNGNAYVNGDVITMFDGTRVEVVNTDAEGRMILADALAYAKKFNPSLVIDVATLTGSAMRAIGKEGIVAMQHNASGEFRSLKISGEAVYERLVEFPLWKEYGEELKSEVADIRHLGGANAGAITAGKFLEHFTDYPFIHLDIAGPAFTEKASGLWSAGGTGVPVRLLYHFLSQKN